MKWLTTALFLAAGAAHATVTLPNPANTRVSVNNWHAMQSRGVVKQDYDYSCGAASLATVLNSYYGMNLAELEVLDAMGETDKASFSNLAQVVQLYGFKGVGLALSFDQLKQLKIPAIVYLKHRGQGHFSVLRGIREDGRVALADPSWGNRVLIAEQFLKMWQTREHQELVGKVLLLIPQDASPPTHAEFFAPPRHNRQLHNFFSGAARF